MSKAIAIIDMPKNCNDCKFLGYFGLTHPYCQLIGLHKMESLEVDFKNRPQICPLIEFANFTDDEDKEDEVIKGVQNVLNKMFYERTDLNE